MKFRFMSRPFLTAGLLTVLAFSAAEAAQQVTSKSEIQIEYTLDINGVPAGPGLSTAEFRLGQGIFPSEFEKPLIGLEVGDSASIKLDPEDGYGKRKPELIKEISKDLLPESVRDGQKGQSFNLKGTNGKVYYVRVADVRKNTVVLDQNHPLAGKYLTYYITVTAIR